MAKMPKVLPEELSKPKVDVSLGGLQYPDNTFVCMLCYRAKGFRVKTISQPVFRVELTGREMCSVCSKPLADAFIIDNVAD